MGIHLAPTALLCTTLTQAEKKIKVPSFELHTFKQPVIKNLAILSMSTLTALIKNYVQKNNLSGSYTLLSLAHPGIVERIITLNNEHPQEHHLQQSEHPQKLIWDFMNLEHKAGGKKTYYLCGITREQLFHYQLLAIQAALPCIAIVPQRAALLKASNYLLANNVQPLSNHAMVQSYIDYAEQKLSQTTLIEIPHNIEKKQVLESLGLFLIGQEIYEQY